MPSFLFFFRVNDSRVHRSLYDGRCLDVPEKDDSTRIQAKMCSFRETVGDECSAPPGHFAGVRCSKLSSQQLCIVEVFESLSVKGVQ